MHYTETISIIWHSIVGETPEPNRDIIVKHSGANSVWQPCTYIAAQNVPQDIRRYDKYHEWAYVDEIHSQSGDAVLTDDELLERKSMESFERICKADAEKLAEGFAELSFDDLLPMIEHGYVSNDVITQDDFSSICSECGLEVETAEVDLGKIDVVAYVSSPVLRDGKTSFSWWNNYVLSGGAKYYGFYDALWRETSTGKYTLNGTDLGDCLTSIESKEQLREVCLNVMHALKRLENDADYRPKMIDLNMGRYVRTEESNEVKEP